MGPRDVEGTVTGAAWRTLALVLGVACAGLTWRDCTRAPSSGASAACPEDAPAAARRRTADRDDAAPARGGRDDEATDDGTGATAWGLPVPAWLMALGPQPGENLLDYRDRIVPLAQTAIAPHRARVTRGRDEFFAAAGVNAQQRAELDAAVEEAAATIQDRVLNAALGGELDPATLRPMAGVAVARDVLDAVDRANRRFLGALRADQRAALAHHPFDLADYLLFSTRWEDMLGAK